MASEKRPIGLRAELTEHVYGATVETDQDAALTASVALTEMEPARRAQHDG